MPRPDPVWLDQQYNNRARIPEHAAIFGRWGLASGLARDKLAGHLDLAYGHTPAETLDVFAAPREAAPVLVFVHGGYWRSLDKRVHTFIAPAFTHAGTMVVIPNYALCPDVTIDEISLQLVRALEWTYRNAARYGGDPNRIVVAGHSAGGHLAAMMLSCRWPQVARDLPPTLVAAAVSISGLFDLEPLRHTPFLQSDLRLTEASAKRLSPVRFEAPSGPCTHGSAPM